MISFKNRSNRKELLDSTDIPFADIQKNMEELDFINHALGGHRITLAGLKEVLSMYPLVDGPVQIVEIGCGGGDNLRVISQWAKDNSLPVQLTGIDLNAACIDFARSQE